MTHARRGISRLSRLSDSRLWLAVFLPVAVVYLASAHWSLPSTDATAAAWPAWAVAHQGTLVLDHVRNLPSNPFFLRGAGGHLVSSRMPGVVLINVPAQALLSWTGISAVGAATITASLVSAAAVANVSLLFRRLSNTPTALSGVLLLAFGSCLWTVAGAELWTHGPDVFWLSAGLVALASRRTWLAGLLLAPAVMTRPHLIVVVFSLVIITVWSQRSRRPVIALVLPSVSALAVVLLYNWWLFDTPSLAAGSYSYAAHNALTVDGPQALASGHGPATLVAELRNWAINFAGLLGSPMRGAFAYTPLLLLVSVAPRRTWRQLPDWARGAFIGGVAYLLIQARLNLFDGGFGYYGSRLTLESVVLVAPLVFVTASNMWREGRRGLIVLLAAMSVGIQIVGASLGRIVVVPWQADPWRTWLPATVLARNGFPSAVIITLVLLLAALVALRVRSPKPTPQREAVERPSTESGHEQLTSPMFNRAIRVARQSPASGTSLL